jgi:hypothetical protein
MAQNNVTPPNLPLPPNEYEREYFDKLTNALRLYFNQLSNPGPMSGATQRNGTAVFSGLSFFQPDPATPNTFVASLPTQADLSNLRVGDVYYDTTAGNVLKVKV